MFIQLFLVCLFIVCYLFFSMNIKSITAEWCFFFVKQICLNLESEIHFLSSWNSNYSSQFSISLGHLESFYLMWSCAIIFFFYLSSTWDKFSVLKSRKKFQGTTYGDEGECCTCTILCFAKIFRWKSLSIAFIILIDTELYTLMFRCQDAIDLLIKLFCPCRHFYFSFKLCNNWNFVIKYIYVYKRCTYFRDLIYSFNCISTP